MTDDEYQEEEANRVRPMLALLGKAQRRIGSAGKLLDVGAGTGMLVAAASRLGWQAWGVEPSHWCVQVAREKGVRVLHGTVEDLDQGLGPFDVVSLFDVVEHVTDPLELVCSSASRLKARGQLVVTTPDLDSLAARFLGRRWWHVRMAHLHLFSRTSLMELLRRAGLRAVHVQRYAWTFSLRYWVTRLERVAPVRRAVTRLDRTQLGRRLLDIPVSLDFRDSLSVIAERDEGCH